jgi:hypothetical protein
MCDSHHDHILLILAGLLARMKLETQSENGMFRPEMLSRKLGAKRGAYGEDPCNPRTVFNQCQAASWLANS